MFIIRDILRKNPAAAGKRIGKKCLLRARAFCPTLGETREKAGNRMRIDNTPPIKGTDKTGKKKSTSSTSSVDFEGFLHESDDVGAPLASQATTGVNNFLFMQEVSDEEHARQRAMQQGRQAVAALEQLHRDLLMGTVPESTLRRLEGSVARQREVFTDPRLQSLLDEIELRAAVELAKLERARPRG